MKGQEGRNEMKITEKFIKEQVELAKKGCDTKNLKIEYSVETGDVFVNGIQILECEDFEELKNANVMLLLELYVSQVEVLNKI